MFIGLPVILEQTALVKHQQREPKNADLIGGQLAHARRIREGLFQFLLGPSLLGQTNDGVENGPDIHTDNQVLKPGLLRLLALTERLQRQSRERGHFLFPKGQQQQRAEIDVPIHREPDIIEYVADYPWLIGYTTDFESAGEGVEESSHASIDHPLARQAQHGANVFITHRLKVGLDLLVGEFAARLLERLDVRLLRKRSGLSLIVGSRSRAAMSAKTPASVWPWARG